MPETYDAIVLGLGAMGAAATYQLAKRGAKVLGIDQYAPPHEFGSTHGEIYAPTIDFNVSFVKAAKPGKFIARGRVVNIGRTIAFTEAELFDEDGDLVARGTFTCRIMHGDKASGRL